MAKNLVPIRLSPLAALCLQTIRRWWNVVRRGRGGQLVDGTPWTRLPADQLLEQLQREHGISVTVRTVRRALKELADVGALRRQQRYAHRWRRDWWYAPTEQEEALEAHRPSRVAAASPMSARAKPSVPYERTAASGQVLDTPVCSSFLKENSRKTNNPNGGKGFAVARKALGDRLEDVVRRARGRGSAAGASQRPEMPSKGARETRDGKLFTRIGGLLVVDDPKTAPLR